MKSIGFVGVGHIHTPGFVDRLNKRDDFEVKAVWDHDPERARITAEKLGSSTVADVTAIWEDDAIEAVVICSETNRHEELVVNAAASKKHMFVEKPLGMGAQDAYRMAATVDDAGVLFQTGYFMRSQPVHLFLKDQIEKGSFGKITRIRHSNCHSGSINHWFDAGRGWFADGWMWMTDYVQAGIGAFGDLGTHSLDILMWLMGDVAQVTAQTDVALGNYGECDEFGEGLLRFDNGVVGTIAAGWVDVENPVSVLISGTEGHATVFNRQLFFSSNHVTGADGKSVWTDLPDERPHAFELFLDALNGHDMPLVTPQEAAARSAVMEALYQAAKTHTWGIPQKPTTE